MSYKTREARNAYNKKLYEERRNKLLILMGGECHECKCKDFDLLEFDHINGDREWSTRKHGQTTRLRLHKQDYFKGKVRILCRSCNASRNQHYHKNGGKEYMEVIK